MAFLFEHPWWIVGIGIGIEVILGIILLCTRRGVLLWAMLGVLAVAFLSLLIERLVVTDREQIEATLHGGAAAFQANDLQRGLSYFPPEAGETREIAATIMRMVEIQTARIYDLNITIDRNAIPPTAKAVFLAYASYRDRKGDIPYTNYAEYLIVDLRKENGKWILTGHIEEKGQDPVKNKVWHK